MVGQELIRRMRESPGTSNFLNLNLHFNVNPKELQKLIEFGENLKIEFKQRFSTHIKIAKELIAFANTAGGHLIIGVDDDGSLYGVQSEKGEAELIKETVADFCEPEIKYNIEYIELHGKELVVVNVPESANKPHRIKDYKTLLDLNTAEVFIRVADKSVPASKEMIKILQANTKRLPMKNYNFGRTEEIVFDMLRNKETVTVRDLSEHANISRRRASRTLIKLVRINLLNIHTKDNGEDFFTSSGEL
jgi:predicted HTH transcriptional regulator